MTLNAIRNVGDLPENERQSIEHLLGQSLANDQEIFIMAFSPGKRADEPTRAEAAKSLTSHIDELRADLECRGISAEQVDTAIDEAMAQVRQRTS